LREDIRVSSQRLDVASISVVETELRNTRPRNTLLRNTRPLIIHEICFT